MYETIETFDEFIGHVLDGTPLERYDGKIWEDSKANKNFSLGTLRANWSTYLYRIRMLSTSSLFPNNVRPI
jgi:hypothetical protein